jgi:hypothetical protein
MLIIILTFSISMLFIGLISQTAMLIGLISILFFCLPIILSDALSIRLSTYPIAIFLDTAHFESSPSQVFTPRWAIEVRC